MLFTSHAIYPMKTTVLCFGFKWSEIQTLTFCSFKFSFDCRRTYPVVNHSAEGLAIKLVTHASSVYDLKSAQTQGLAPGMHM